MMCCRGLARALTVAIILLIALPCRAANLSHHDLSSLAYLADAVVRARVTSGLHERMGVRTHEVLEVYAGPLAVGEVFEAPWGSLVLERLWGAGDDWHVDDEVVVFLVRDASGPRLVPSGLRVFVDGRA
ncbi:MAG: hypothetical protein KC636_05430, partial [Myxococcales bacterium]|nr:hypothetical protein [Myxococcales bacterium]